MARRSARRILSLLMVLSIFLASSPLSAHRARAGAGEGGRYLVDTRDRAALEQVKAQGAVMLADYGSFSLWQVSPGAAGLNAQKSVPGSLTPVDDAIFLRGVTLRPASALPAMDGKLAPQPSAAGFWMVQFIGPVKAEWLAALAAAGLEPAAYIPNNTYVVWGERVAAQVAALAGAHPEIRWSGPYAREYRLHPDLQGLSGAELVEITVQVYDHVGAEESVERLRALALAITGEPYHAAGFITLSARVPSPSAAEIAGWEDVFNVEPALAPVMLDEAQGQILAGSLIRQDGNMIPNGPGYLDWLASKGFPTDPAQYPIVDVVDDGIDTGSLAPGHSDFYEQGSPSNPSRVAALSNCTGDPLPDSGMGHGSINAGIIAGYNNLPGFPYEDESGYQLGLGISPYGRVSGTKYFANSGVSSLMNCGWQVSGLVAKSVANGAKISSNSWGSSGSLGSYTTTAWTYDLMTRDADPGTPGDQPMLHIFSAGNYGWYNGGPRPSISPPGTAKNVLTVGATESARGQGVLDGCNIADANSADDIANFSSRGPTSDGRAKPDLVAPGTHIQGPASQSPSFNGAEVCGAPGDKYYPPAQALYTWSSGTSHSAPAVSGAAQLAYEYYGRVLAPGSQPSPAMLKALLVNSARYLSGYSSGDTLPSANQGWGDANLGVLFDSAGNYLLDQTTRFTATGEELAVTGGVIDPYQPFRVTLAWTDAPGSTTGAAYVNNLDLEVTVGGQTYKGNQFLGASSVPGGAADSKNNLENVFLPAGTAGPFIVRVIARNLAGDGVPSQPGATDQDFALVIDNGSTVLAPALVVETTTFTPAVEPVIPGAAVPGEVVDVTVTLRNLGSLAAEGLSGELQLVSGNATILSSATTFPDIGVGETASSVTPFQVRIEPQQSCGTPVIFRLALAGGSGYTASPPVTLPVGFAVTTTIPYGGPPVPVPDFNPAGASVQVKLPNLQGVVLVTQDVSARLSVEHRYAKELALRLAAPGGASVLLSDGNGAYGANYTATVFDDGAPLSITQGAAPFTGSYRPEQPLAALDGSPAGGAWILTVVDSTLEDAGQITEFSVTVKYATCDPAYFQPPFRQILPLVSAGQ